MTSQNDRPIGPLRFVISTVGAFLGRECPTHAAAIAFHTSFSLFPILLALAALLAVFDWGGDVYQRILELAEVNLALDRSILPAAATFPKPGVGLALLIAAIALLWSVLQIVSAARRGLEAAWQLHDRPHLADAGVEIGGVLALLGMALLGGVTVSAIAVGRALLGDLLGIDWLWSFFDNWVYRGLLELLSIAFSFAGAWGFYQILSGPAAGSRESIPGALFVAAVLPLLKIGFWAYFELFTQFSAIYGSIASFVAVLLWIFLSANVFLFGGVICERWAVGRA